MTLSLTCHPATPCEAVSNILVEARRAGGRIELCYRLEGDRGALLLPARREDCGRRDELWKTTCFEAFVRPPDAPGYLELNLSPSGDWAAYAFTGYREGMAPALDVTPEPPVFDNVPGGAELTTAVSLFTLPPGLWHVSLTAVIEEIGGRTSYWALRHPPGKPDFHHADGFVLELA